MARNGYSNVFHMSLGHTLESELIDTFATFFYKGNSKVDRSVFRFATVEEDKFFGTDAFMYGLPVDFTRNIKGKNHTTILDASVDLPGVGKVTFGIRTGNGRVKFETPVLVIGVNLNTGSEDDGGFIEGSMLKFSLSHLIDAVKKQVQQIIDIGSGAYWDYCDAAEV